MLRSGSSLSQYGQQPVRLSWFPDGEQSAPDRSSVRGLMSSAEMEIFCLVAFAAVGVFLTFRQWRALEREKICHAKINKIQILWLHFIQPVMGIDNKMVANQAFYEQQKCRWTKWKPTFQPCDYVEYCFAVHAFRTTLDNTCEASAISFVFCGTSLKVIQRTVEECARLPARWGVFFIKPWHDGLRQPWGTEPSVSQSTICLKV